jgi:hypothetical protein
MFFNKSPKPSPAEQEDTRIRTVQQYQDQLDTALGLPDPAEKLLRLDEIASSSREKSFQTRMGLVSNAGPSVLATCVGMGGFLLTPLIVLGLVLQLPVIAAFAALPGVCIGAGICLNSWYKDTRRQIAENKTLFDGLGRIAATAENACTVTLRDHLPDLAQSLKRDELHKRLPSLKALFAKVFEKQAQPATPIPQPALANKLNL